MPRLKRIARDQDPRKPFIETQKTADQVRPIQKNGLGTNFRIRHETTMALNHKADSGEDCGGFRSVQVGETEEEELSGFMIFIPERNTRSALARSFRILTGAVVEDVRTGERRSRFRVLGTFWPCVPAPVEDESYCTGPRRIPF